MFSVNIYRVEMRISSAQAQLETLTTVSSGIVSTQIHVINSFLNLVSGNDNLCACACQKVKPL